jgi:hypothetical protein
MEKADCDLSKEIESLHGIGGSEDIKISICE